MNGHFVAKHDQQAHKLRDAIANAGLEHGQEALVNIENVTIHTAVPAHESREAVFAEMRFCKCSVDVQDVTQWEPEPGEIPEILFLDSALNVPHVSNEDYFHHYRIENVILRTNGHMELIATPETQFVQIDLKAEQKQVAEEADFPAFVFA